MLLEAPCGEAPSGQPGVAGEASSEMVGELRKRNAYIYIYIYKHQHKQQHKTAHNISNPTYT